MNMNSVKWTKADEVNVALEIADTGDRSTNDPLGVLAEEVRRLGRELGQVKASDEMHWRTLRECADLLCLPDESPSLLPEKIRLMQAVCASEKKAKVERGEMVVELRLALSELVRLSGGPYERTMGQFAEWQAAKGVAHSLLNS